MVAGWPLASAPTAYDGGELGAVMARAAAVGRIDNPAAFAWCMAPAVDGKRIEQAWVAVLDAWCSLATVQAIGRKRTRDSVRVDLDRVVQAATRERARYAILAHNHPSGDSTPSSNDAELTTDADGAARAAGVILLDHVVLGRGEVYSFREGRKWLISNTG
jgi:DNA repair protein RadC